MFSFWATRECCWNSSCQIVAYSIFVNYQQNYCNHWYVRIISYTSSILKLTTLHQYLLHFYQVITILINIHEAKFVNNFFMNKILYQYFMLWWMYSISHHSLLKFFTKHQHKSNSEKSNTRMMILAFPLRKC